MTHHSIGVDISKSYFDAYNLQTDQTQRFDNSRKGFQAFRRWLKGTPVHRIVYEPTGAYHKVFENEAEDIFPLVRVNPLQARRFAEAYGTRAKIDRVDARLLAQMGHSFELAPQPLNSKTQRILRELHGARHSLIAERTRLKNRIKIQDIPILKRQLKASLSQVEKQIAQLDKEIHKLLKQQPDKSHQLDILCSIPGIAQITASAILAFLPEIGTLTRKQVASLAGLAPFTRTSGQWVGKSFIQGGRKPLRDALYMPALVAIRFNPDFKAKYQQLRNAGKPSKLVLIAIMRKLLELANTLIKADQKWVSKNP